VFNQIGMPRPFLFFNPHNVSFIYMLMRFLFG
jgi:hypothetical protein